jgi:hypothetical protein
VLVVEVRHGFGPAKNTKHKTNQSVQINDEVSHRFHDFLPLGVVGVMPPSAGVVLLPAAACIDCEVLSAGVDANRSPSERDLMGV